jgi:hypothetical protein
MNSHVIIIGTHWPPTVRCLHCGLSQPLPRLGTHDGQEDLMRQINREHRACKPPLELPWRLEKRRRGRGSLAAIVARLEAVAND